MPTEYWQKVLGDLAIGITDEARSGGSLFRRLIRTLCVVGPLLLIGFALGLGWRMTERQPPPPPMQLEGTQDVIVAGAEGGSEPGTSAPGLIDRDTLRLIGQGDTGTLNEVEFETTDLPLADAVSQYDSDAARQGWELNGVVMNAMRGAAEDSALRGYTKDGRLRIVVIGAPVMEGRPARPVTVFEGPYRTP